jgi:hypothetical protein
MGETVTRFAISMPPSTSGEVGADDPDVGVVAHVVGVVGDVFAVVTPSPAQRRAPGAKQRANRLAFQIHDHQIAAPATEGELHAVGRWIGTRVALVGSADEVDVERERFGPA